MFLCILKINKSNTPDRVGRKTIVYKAYTEILIWFIIIKKVKWMFRKKAQELATKKTQSQN